MSLAYIALGSNIGDGRTNLKEAWTRLGEVRGITLLALSSPYLTRPEMKKAWEKERRHLSEQWFTNAVGVLETRMTAHELLVALKETERLMGRDRQKTVDRTVDLDILFFDELVVNDVELVLPHPELHKRSFVLAPLDEIAPDRVHPVTGQTVNRMLRTLPSSPGDIRKLAWE